MSYTHLFLLQATFVEKSDYATLALILASVGLSGLLFLLAIVSGAEISYFSLSDKTIQSFQHSQNKIERQVAYLLSKPRNLQITFIIVLRLIKITFITLAVFTIEHFFLESVGEWYVLVLLFSVILLIFGELVPRVYAHERHIRFTKRHAYEVAASYYLFYPFAKVMSFLSEWLERRVTPQRYDVDIEELPEVLDEIELEGESVESDKHLLREIVKFTTSTVAQVMIPRQKIFALCEADVFSVILQKVRDTGFSRLPVYKENLDEILGILYLKDLLVHQHATDDFEWISLLRPATTVPETQRIMEVFRKFKTERIHIAIVGDEFGTTLGLITMEDLVEEVIGDLTDEFDDHETLNYSKLTQHRFVFDGKDAIESVCKAMQIPEEVFDDIRAGSQTLNGLLSLIWRKMPRVGEERIYGKFKFIIQSANIRMILKVEIELLP